MPVADQLTPQNLVASLRSTTCPACGRAKTPRQTFCRSQYFALPRPMRTALYARLGAGYREAVAEAMEFLQAEAFQLPPDDPQRS